MPSDACLSRRENPPNNGKVSNIAETDDLFFLQFEILFSTMEDM